jgi:hypothetical protein
VLGAAVLAVDFGQPVSACAGPQTAPEIRQEVEVPNDNKAGGSAPANRLAGESSPYLLMHAHNPVDWYPWGTEAFDKARTESKPVFLSVGYSSCYWCHVMERQVFSNQKVADYLNEHYVCIKVDREERPDVDDIYMTSLIVYQQAAGRAGGGGWPLSMFLTPDGDPIAGATYLPPEDTPDGRVGFLTAAAAILDAWDKQRESTTGSAAMIAREVRRLSGTAVLSEASELKAELLTAVTADIGRRFDPVYGGVDFNPRNPGGPRFPNVPRLLFLLDQVGREPNSETSRIIDDSLTAMACGGIRDHLGGGFHRYSTDRQWIVPHFEKMLYDQAQLLEAYSLAAAAEQNPLYDQVIEELVRFMVREMTLPDGGFCAALDAETNAIEGEYYVWTEDAVRAGIPAADVESFLATYGFHEPSTFEHGRVLHVPLRPAAESDPAMAIPAQARTMWPAIEQLAAARGKLLEARSLRERPFLDDKVLTEWNALMIQALATSGRLPGRESDLQLAARAADFLLTSMNDDTGLLLRSWRNGVRGPRAYLDDYACFISALLALHTSTNDERWLTEAKRLQDEQNRLFHDATQQAYFFTSHEHEKLFARGCSPYDSVSPSGNSISVRNLLALAERTGTSEYRSIAESTLRRFSGTLAANPSSCAGFGLALADYLATQPEPAPPAALRKASAGYILTAGQDEPADAGDTQSAFKPVLPDPAAPASPFKRNYTERPVKAKIYPMFDKLERGGKCPVAIELTIAPEWHINANPANPKFLIPTEVKIKTEQRVEMTKVRYPKHELLEVVGQDEPSHVYGGTQIIYVLLETSADETADKAELEVEIKFQACNENTCEAPDAIKLKGKLPLANPGDDIKRINEKKFPKDDDEPADDNDEAGATSPKP